MSNKAYAQYTITDVNDGVGILKIEEQYCKSIYDNLEDLESHNPEWLDYQPVWENGYYIWTRSKITWDSDDKVPNPSYTEPVLATTFQTLYSDIVNHVIPNIAVKDSNGKWSLVSGVLQNTYLYTDEERNVPVYLSTLGSAITTTADSIRQEVSNNYISSDKLKGSYVVCSTQADVSAKTALCSDQEIIDGFELYDGMAINCVFANGNTAYNSSNPITLSVNGTTAYPIRDFDGTILTEEESKLYAGAMVTFIYDDTAKCWKMQNTGTVAKISSNSTLIEQTSRNILIQATSGTNVTNTDVGDALISFINVAPDEVKISADVIDFEGTAIFSDYLKTENLSTELTNRGYITSTKIGETYATKSAAIVETQRIYMQTNTSQKPDTPSDDPKDWALSTTDTDKWTTQRRSYDPNYPYLWTCEQRKTAEGKLLYTPVLLDDTTTIIDGGSIIARSITSSAISTDLIQSLNYSPPTGDENSGTGTYPYSVSGTFLNLENGDITSPNFVVKGTDAYLRGTIETGAGRIGGFVITGNSIYHNKRDVTSVDLNDDIYIINNNPYILDEEDYLYGGYATLYEVYMGTDGISCGFGKFAVDSSGDLFASNATIKGNITATSGSFGTDNGYYEISSDGLIGYKAETSYYFKMIEIRINGEYDEGSVKISSLSLETSTQSYSYSDILAMDVIDGIDLRYEDNKIYAILKINSDVDIGEIFNGTITTVSCMYTYKRAGEEMGGSNEEYDYAGLPSPYSENKKYITGTELGYDYLKTDKIIASDGIVIATDGNNLTTSSRLQLSNNSIQLYAKEKTTPYFFISDLRDSDGNVIINDYFELKYEDYSQTVEITYTPNANSSITVNVQGADVTGNTDVYTQSGNYFTFSDLPNPINGIIISYVITPNNSGYTAYTLGQRVNNNSIGNGSVALGYRVIASGVLSIATGDYTQAQGKCSFANGEGSYAMGENSFSMGRYCKSRGKNSFAFGGIYDDFGLHTTLSAYGDNSIAHGHVNEFGAIVSEGEASIASGFVGGINRDAFDYITDDIKGGSIAASGTGSIALGCIPMNQTASNEAYITSGGPGSLSCGYLEYGDMGTSNYAEGAVALNTGTWALGKAQTVIGTFNALDNQGNVTNHPSNSSGNSSAYYTKYAFIIGNGYWNKTNNTEVRSNAMTVDWFGHITALSFEVPTGHDLLLKSSGGTYTARLTQYGNFRPEGVGTQSLGTSDNPWKDVWANDTTINPSDRKLKDNIDEISFSEKLIMNLKPITYMWKNGDHRRKRMGFIAQDVANVCKDIGENLSIVTASYKSDEQKIYLGEDIDDSLLNWGMSYSQLIAPMVSVIQSHENTIIELNNKINKLESYIKEIKRQMS